MWGGIEEASNELASSDSLQSFSHLMGISKVFLTRDKSYDEAPKRKQDKEIKRFNLSGQRFAGDYTNEEGKRV